MPASLDLMAPAKVNLSLEVLARLPNGYHELDSWMHKISLFDQLSLAIVEQPGIQLRCSDSSLPCDDRNLVYRAASLFYENINQDPRIAITLQKNIPIAAGLGGGSSDCAATLKGLNRLHGNPLSHERLLELGKSLGADVPFLSSPFVRPGPEALVKGFLV